MNNSTTQLNGFRNWLIEIKKYLNNTAIGHGREKNANKKGSNTHLLSADPLQARE
jgi:hypothetical protein